MANNRSLIVLSGTVLIFGNCQLPECLDWKQWGQNSGHQGNVCSAGQPATTMLDDVVIDPFVPGEAADGDGLIVHYQTPLIADDDVYVETKSGNYFACNPPGSGMPDGCGPPKTWKFEIWNEVHYKIADNGKLTKDWSFESDWKPEPFYGFEPVFHAALSGKFIYIPGAGGTVYKLDRKSGKQVARLNPFGSTVDVNTYVAGPISVDELGHVYYNVMKLDPRNPYFPVLGSWLVKADAEDHIKTATYDSLVPPDAPKATDMCAGFYNFQKDPKPWPLLNPDGTVKLPPQYQCGAQRATVNLAPAIAPDGTIYVASHAHNNEYYSYLIAVNPDLTPRWQTSLRNLVNDGCGVLVPDDGDKVPSDCTPGSPQGIDPQTGLAPAMGADDSSTASPVVLPDGDVLYGGLSSYNGFRGHLLKFDHHGKFKASFDFGWDITPAVYPHDGTYSLLLKDNHYHYDANGNDDGQYYLTRVDANLKPEWKFQSTNTQSCTRNPDNTVSCVSDHPTGFEWCINAPAIDRDGNMFANSEDGNLYVIDKNGKEKEHLFLNLAQGAAYTPLAIDANGHIFVLNAGHMSVIGQVNGTSTLPKQYQQSGK
jgi:hypothetical protein